MSIHDLNPALAALTAAVEALGDGWWGEQFHIVKALPPDAMLVELPGGTQWIVWASQSGGKKYYE